MMCSSGVESNIDNPVCSMNDEDKSIDRVRHFEYADWLDIPCDGSFLIVVLRDGEELVLHPGTTVSNRAKHYKVCLM